MSRSHATQRSIPDTPLPCHLYAVVHAIFMSLPLVACGFVAWALGCGVASYRKATSFSRARHPASARSRTGTISSARSRTQLARSLRRSSSRRRTGLAGIFTSRARRCRRALGVCESLLLCGNVDMLELEPRKRIHSTTRLEENKRLPCCTAHTSHRTSSWVEKGKVREKATKINSRYA